MPSDAAVTSVSTDKLFYTLNDNISFSGIEDEGSKQIIVVVRNPSGDYMGNMGDPLSDADGNFETIPRPIKDFVSRSGTYNATAFSESQRENEGISLLLVFDGDTISVAPNFTLELQKIGDKIVEQEKTLTFVVSVTDPSLEDLEFNLERNVPGGASIGNSTGIFTWTPTISQGPGDFRFDVVVNKGPIEDRQTITITVNKAQVTQPPEPPQNPKDEQKEAFQKIIVPKKDPSYYLGRYNDETAYKNWFDDNFPDITIYEALGIADPSAPEPKPKPAGNLPAFVDPNKDPQYYIDRYNNEPTYKDWFDTNYPEWTIYEAVGLENPAAPKELAPFVDPNQDPQYYIDRYNKDDTYKDWFDRNFPDMTIYQAVGLDEPPRGICGPDTIFIDGVCEGIMEQKSSGGCLIATATYGSELSSQVQELREIRDGKLLQTESGSAFLNGFNQIYYSFSPTIADWERNNPVFKEAVKVTITPLLATLSLLNYVDINSEAEVMGFGISLILLNLGMYFVSPAILIWQVKKRI